MTDNETVARFVKWVANKPRRLPFGPHEGGTLRAAETGKAWSPVRGGRGLSGGAAATFEPERGCLPTLSLERGGRRRGLADRARNEHNEDGTFFARALVRFRSELWQGAFPHDPVNLA